MCLMLRSLNPITKETPMTTRCLRWTSPDPGPGPQVELRRRDASGLLNLLRIGKALPGERIATEESPPALLQIEPARSGGNEDLLDAWMPFQPGARLQAVMTAELVVPDLAIPSVVTAFSVNDATALP